MKNITIGYAGISHLGLNSSIAAAEKVTKVIAFDYNKKMINELKLGKTIINEPNLKNKISELKDKIHFTSNIKDLIKCDIVYISQDVPTNNEGESDLSSIEELVQTVNLVIKKETTLVILCQVPPGFTRKIKRPIRKLYYQVETLIFGRAIERATLPERIILGCSDEKHFIDVNLNNFLKSFNCPIISMVYESAELAKTAINIILASQVSVANSLAEICEKFKGDWNEIIPALKLDKRIGHYAYLNPGLGISGGNIERDLRTLSEISKKHKANNIYLESIIQLSNYRKKWVQNIFLKENNINKVCNICVLGLTYKLETDSLKNSPSIELINTFKNVNIKVYDPIVKKINANNEVIFCNSAYEAVKEAEMLFIMLPYQEFKDLKWNKIFSIMKKRIIIDPFRVINSKYNDKNLTLYVLGKK